MFSTAKTLPLILTFVYKLFTSSSLICEIKCGETLHHEYQRRCVLSELQTVEDEDIPFLQNVWNDVVVKNTALTVLIYYPTLYLFIYGSII
jgi:hypothetical protein